VRAVSEASGRQEALLIVGLDRGLGKANLLIEVCRKETCGVVIANLGTVAPGLSPR
jgi:hypothetical protein